MQNKFRKLSIITFCSCFVLHNIVYTQTIDTINLNTVTILDYKFNPYQGLKTYAIDSISIISKATANMSDLLCSKTSVFIKSYGQGGLATASFRGTSASHTPVYWNDIAIHSPMLSQMDFSLLPVFFLDKVSLFYGGSSLINKSGGLGGSINLENKKVEQTKNKVSLIQQIGSFSTFGNYIDANYKYKNVIGRTRVMHLNSKNDFSFLNNAVANTNYLSQTRENASYNQYGLLQELYFNPKIQNEFSLKIWLQNYYREIPQPLIVIPIPNNENQTNKSFRSVANWKHHKLKSKIETSLAYSYDFLNYKNKISFINSENICQNISSNIKYYSELSSLFSINTGITGDYYLVKSNNYKNIKNRRHISLYTVLNSSLKNRFFINIVFLKELTDEKFQPILPSFGVEYKLLNNNLLLKGNISKNYHLPSLNDLYWYPGGNPNLLPEKGYSYELGFKYSKIKQKELEINTEITYFRTNITNWILWQPDPVFRYWTPLNLKEVVSSGIECNLDLFYKINYIIFRFNTIHTYTSAKNIKPIYQNDNTSGKQLIYTPFYTFNGSLQTEYKNFFVTAETQHVGKRYTNTTNTRYMPAYQTNDILIGLKLNAKRQSFIFQFTVCNIFDINYQAIAWQPMPGINYELMLKIDFLR